MAEIQQNEQQVQQIVDETPIREDVEAEVEPEVDPPAVAQGADNGTVAAEQANVNGELCLQFDLEDIPVEKDKYKWELPTELAAYFSKYTRKHYADSDLAAWIEQYPTPSNVDCVLGLDNTMRRALKEEGKNSAIDADDDMLQIQRRIQDVLGPLGVNWAEMQLYMGGPF